MSHMDSSGNFWRILSTDLASDWKDSMGSREEIAPYGDYDGRVNSFGGTVLILF